MRIEAVTKSLLMLGIACLASGCSSAPDEGDVRAAIEANLNQTNEAMLEMAGSEAAKHITRMSLEEFELLGCEEGGKDAYNCDVKVSIDTPMFPIRGKAMTLRLRKSGAGWTVMEGLQ